MFVVVLINVNHNKNNHNLLGASYNPSQTRMWTTRFQLQRLWILHHLHPKISSFEKNTLRNQSTEWTPTGSPPIPGKNVGHDIRAPVCCCHGTPKGTVFI